MTNITSVCKKYINNAIIGTGGHYLIARCEGKLYYFRNRKRESVLSLSMVMDFGDSVREYTVYDSCNADASVPGIKIVWNTDDNDSPDKLICISETLGCQLIGFRSESLEEAEDVSLLRQAKHIFVYFRTNFYHRCLFADLALNSFSIITEYAAVDEKREALPDAVTGTIASLFAGKAAGETEKAGAVSEVSENE